jgi:thymidylate kinase
MYISLAMHAQLSQLIEAKRELGIIVLVDRSPLSNVAYQAYGSGLDVDFSMGIIDIDMQLFKPDCIIVYDAPITITKERMLARNLENKAKKEYFESKPNEYFERVATGYRAAAAHFGASVIEAVDSVESVHKETMKVVNKCLR